MPPRGGGAPSAGKSISPSSCGDAGGGQRDRAIRRCAVMGLAHRAFRIVRAWRIVVLRIILRRRIVLRLGRIGRPRISGLRHRPARLVADAAGRTRAFVGKTISRVRLAECGNLQRKLGTADAGTRNRLDAHDLGVLFHCARLQARDLGLGAPRFALGGLKKPAAATRKRDKDDRADKMQTNSALHRATFDDFI